MLVDEMSLNSTFWLLPGSLPDRERRWPLARVVATWDSFSEIHKSQFPSDRTGVTG